MAVATAIIGSAVIGAGATAYSAKKQKKADKKAAAVQAAATDKAADREDKAAKENLRLQNAAFNKTENRLNNQINDASLARSKAEKIRRREVLQNRGRESRWQQRDNEESYRLETSQIDLMDKQISDFSPWRDMGEKAISTLWDEMDSGAYDIDIDKYKLNSDNYQVDAGKYQVDGNDYKVDASNYTVDADGYQVNADDYKVNADDYQVGDIDVTKDPGYKWRMEQGQEAQERSAAARGMTMSGAQSKALQDYSQGLASQEYGVAYNREYDKQTQAYNREYGQQTDLYNREYDKQNNRYNRAWDSQTQGYNREAMQQNNLYSREYNRQNDAYNREYSRQNDRYGRDYQRNTDAYNREFDQDNRRINILSGMSQQGFNAAGNIANARQNFSNQQSRRQSMFDGRVSASQGREAMLNMNEIDVQQNNLNRLDSNIDRYNDAQTNLPIRQAGVAGNIIANNAGNQSQYSLAQGSIQANQINSVANANSQMAGGIAQGANQMASNWILNSQLQNNNGGNRMYNRGPVRRNTGYDRNYNQGYA